MWTLLALLCLLLIGFLWVRTQSDSDVPEQAPPSALHPGLTVPPVASVPPCTSNLSITYTLSKWDLFLTNVRVILGNRVILGLDVLILLWLEWQAVGNYRTTSISWLALMMVLIALGFGLFILMATLPVIFCLSVLFRNRGVAGQHTLQITAEGLKDLSDVNEALFRWPHIGRIKRTANYLHIKVGESVYTVPKRCVPEPQLMAFEKELRARVAPPPGVSAARA